MFNSSLTNLAIVFGFFQESFYDCRVWLYPGLQNSGRTEVFQEIKPKSDKSSFGGDMPAPTWSWAWYNSGMYLIVFMVSCGFLISPLQVQIIHVQRFILSGQMVKHNAYDKDDYAQEFGITISDRLASVQARILPAPRVGWPIFCLFWPFCFTLSHALSNTSVISQWNILSLTLGIEYHKVGPKKMPICKHMASLTSLFLYFRLTQLKYNETGQEKDCLPRVGQWNMMNKVTAWMFFCSYNYWPDAREVEEGRQYAVNNFIVTGLTLASCAYCSSAILPNDCFYSNHTSPCALHDTSSMIISSYFTISIWSIGL